MEKIAVGCQSLVLFCTLFRLLFVGETLAANCSSKFGPSGSFGCMNFYPLYNGYQWATCITDSYMRQKSKGRHACTNTTGTYCWYQCMLETYNVGPGLSFPAPVYGDCACNSDSLQTTQGPSPMYTLPPWCFSPSGQECSWYKNCLEEQLRCEGTDSAYAVTYAEKFCSLYTDHAAYLSPTGQYWTNAVRKCLQVELVPILRPWVTISCEEIRQTAIKSHSGCYLAPYAGAPSICNLTATDWWKIFWTLKSGFHSSFVESLNGLIDVLKVCQRYVLLYQNDIVMFKFYIERLDFNGQNRSTLEELNNLSGNVADAIASKLRWSDFGIMWYAYSNISTLNSTVPVEVLITGKGIYDLNSPKVSDFNRTTVIEHVMQAIHDGDLFFWKIGDKSEPIYVKQMRECIDFECHLAIQEVTAPLIKYIPPNQCVTTVPPNQNVTTVPPNQNVTTVPPNQNVATVPPNICKSSAFGLTINSKDFFIVLIVISVI